MILITKSEMKQYVWDALGLEKWWNDTLWGETK